MGLWNTDEDDVLGKLLGMNGPMGSYQAPMSTGSEPGLQADQPPAVMAAQASPKAAAQVIAETPPPTAEKPDVNSYIADKYGLSKYSDENRQKLIDENADAGINWKAGLAALGAGLQGQNAAAAGQAVLESQNKARAQKLSDFDSGKKRILEGMDADEKLARKERELDPSSQETMLARSLAQKMVPGMDFGNMTAAQINERIPALTKIYDIEQQKLNRQEQRDFQRSLFNEKAQERKEKLEAEAPKRAFNNLPEEKKQVIEGLAKKNANKIAIANQIDSVLKNAEGKNEDEQLQQYKQLIKVLNSTEGADAVGVEEANRLASKLSFALGNLTNDNPFQVGRDLKGFASDAALTSKSMKDAIKANNQMIDEAYGRVPKDDSSKKEVERKTKDGKIALFDADTKQFIRYK